MYKRVPSHLHLSFKFRHPLQEIHCARFSMGLPSDIIQMNIGQIFQTAILPKTDLTGRTIIVTGANTGLGFEAAKHLSAPSVP